MPLRVEYKSLIFGVKAPILVGFVKELKIGKDKRGYRYCTDDGKRVKCPASGESKPTKAPKQKPAKVEKQPKAKVEKAPQTPKVPAANRRNKPLAPGVVPSKKKEDIKVPDAAKIPTGPIADRIKQYGRGNAIAEILQSMAGEVKVANEQWAAALKILDKAPAEPRSESGRKKLAVAQQKYQQALEAKSKANEANKKAHDLIASHLGGAASKFKSDTDGLNDRQKLSTDEGLEFVSKIVNATGSTNRVKTNKIGSGQGLKGSNNQRAFHRKGDGIFLGASSNTSTWVHEFGHHMESTIPGVVKAAREFVEHRCKDEQPQQLNKLFPNSGYSDDEVGRKDNFDKVFGKGSSAYYVGKTYSDGQNEVTSMGIEMLYNDPIRFASADPEYFSFILGICDGSLREDAEEKKTVKQDDDDGIELPKIDDDDDGVDMGGDFGDFS